MKLIPTVGVNYGPDNVRVEAGEMHDFPADVAQMLLEQGVAKAPRRSRALATDPAPSPESEE